MNYRVNSNMSGISFAPNGAIPILYMSLAWILSCLRKHLKTVYAELLTSSKLNSYLADLNEQADKMFSRLVKDLAEKEGITEKLKAKKQILWVQRMNAVRDTATEIVNHDLIYT